MRYFTPIEANAELERVRPLAERMVAHRRRMLEAQAQQERLESHVSGNGGGIDPAEPAKLAANVEREAEALGKCVDAILELGVQVKDIDMGLVDFPSLRDGEEILLCWHLGEDEIRYWHTLEGGFSARQPL